MGAWLFTNLYTIFKVSDSISSLMVGQPSFLIMGRAEASKALFVKILAALFWSFCSLVIALMPATPHSGQLYLKYGSTKLLYIFCADTFWKNVISLIHVKLFSSLLKFVRPSSDVINNYPKAFYIFYYGNILLAYYTKEGFATLSSLRLYHERGLCYSIECEHLHTCLKNPAGSIV